MMCVYHHLIGSLFYTTSYFLGTCTIPVADLSDLTRTALYSLGAYVCNDKDSPVVHCGLPPFKPALLQIPYRRFLQEVCERCHAPRTPLIPTHTPRMRRPTPWMPMLHNNDPYLKKAYLRTTTSTRHQPTVFGVVSRARNESMALRAKGRAPRCAHGRMRVPGDRVIPIYFGAQPHGRG